MEDVASLAGVSTMTVSRILRRPEKVNAETTKLVRRAMKTLGYVPNQIAGSLSARTTPIVAVVVPTVAHSIFADTVQGISDGLRSHGFQILLGCTNYDPAEEISLITNLTAWRPSGIVITSVRAGAGALRSFRSLRIPVVETWDITKDPQDVVVGFSHFDAGYAMTKYLFEKGYRRIAFARGQTGDMRSVSRAKGYRAATRQFGLPDGLNFAFDYSFSTAGGADALRRILDQRADPDAIFFSVDTVALGALYECQRLGIAVPRQLAIAGFGDFDEARVAFPSLTTVRVPRYEIGTEAARLLLARMSGELLPNTRVDLGFEIVARDSA